MSEKRAFLSMEEVRAIADQMVTKGFLEYADDGKDMAYVTEEGNREIARLISEVTTRLMKTELGARLKNLGILADVYTGEVMIDMFKGDVLSTFIFLFNEKNNNNWVKFDESVKQAIAEPDTQETMKQADKIAAGLPVKARIPATPKKNPTFH